MSDNSYIQTKRTIHDVTELEPFKLFTCLLDILYGNWPAQSYAIRSKR